MYYKLRIINSKRFTGNDSVNAPRMIEGYDYGTKDSVYNWRKNNLPPNLYAIDYPSRNILSDLIWCGVLSSFGDGIFSEKMLSVIEKVNCDTYTAYDAYIFYRHNSLSSYKYVVYEYINEEFINFNRSLFVREIYDDAWNLIEEVDAEIKSSEEYRDPYGPRSVLRRLSLSKEFNYDIFAIAFDVRIIVSQKFVDECAKLNLSGVEFTPFPQIVIE